VEGGESEPANTLQKAQTPCSAEIRGPVFRGVGGEGNKGDGGSCSKTIFREGGAQEIKTN